MPRAPPVDPLAVGHDQPHLLGKLGQPAAGVAAGGDQNLRPDAAQAGAGGWRGVGSVLSRDGAGPLSRCAGREFPLCADTRPPKAPLLCRATQRERAPSERQARRAAPSERQAAPGAVSERQAAPGGALGAPCGGAPGRTFGSLSPAWAYSSSTWSLGTAVESSSSSTWGRHAGCSSRQMSHGGRVLTAA
jgi:hypothetical protein